MHVKRKDIQIYRAISVLLVCFFHAGLGFPNGFLGVDMFFVISGYVIWDLLKRLILENDYPYRKFYIGRIRRIMPAASTYIFFASAALFIFAPLESTATNLRAALFSLFSMGNIEIARQVSDYFQPNAITSPFVHMWSLGIEEQFYLILPIFLIGISKSRKVKHFTLPLVFTAGVFSFLLELFATAHEINSNLIGYYSPFPRVWEFVLGIAVLEINLKFGKYGFNPLILLASLFVLMWIEVEGTGHFLIKVLTMVITSLLLMTRAELKDTFKVTVMTWIGDRSYSIYLWHWSCILILRRINLPNFIYLLLLCIAVLILSELSFKLIEQPIRARVAFAELWKVLFIFLLIPALLLGIMTSFKVRETTSSNSIQTVGNYAGDIGQEDFHSYIYSHFISCKNKDLISQIPRFNNRPQCAFSKDSEMQPKVILLGDSHSEHLFIGLANSLNSINVQYIDTGGLPVETPNINERVFEYVNDMSGPKTVLLSAFWSNRDVPVELAKTIKGLADANTKLFIIGDSPEFSLNPRNCEFSTVENQEALCNEVRIPSQREQESRDKLRTIASQTGTRLIDIRNLFCNQRNLCTMVLRNKLLFRDNNHLSIFGSEYVGKYISRKITE